MQENQKVVYLIFSLKLPDCYKSPVWIDIITTNPSSIFLNTKTIYTLLSSFHEKFAMVLKESFPSSST